MPSPAFGDGRGVYDHQLVVTVVLDRSEWSAKRSRSEREADHERRSANMCPEVPGVRDLTPTLDVPVWSRITANTDRRAILHL